MKTTQRLWSAPMTPEQRCLEVAAILATGLCRLRAKNSAIPHHQLAERQFLLGFGGEPSVHREPNHPSAREL